MSAYTQPEQYNRHDPATCPACRKRARDSAEAGQEGVSALLDGRKLYLAPEGFEATHQRLTRIDWEAVKSDLSPAPPPMNGSAHE